MKRLTLTVPLIRWHHNILLNWLASIMERDTFSNPKWNMLNPCSIVPESLWSQNHSLGYSIVAHEYRGPKKRTNGNLEHRFCMKFYLCHSTFWHLFFGGTSSQSESVAVRFRLKLRHEQLRCWESIQWWRECWVELWLDPTFPPPQKKMVSHLEPRIEFPSRL